MFSLDLNDKKPIYQQIKDSIKHMVINRILKEDEKIPSVRELSQSLTINPNTIQKAYRELELEGYIYSVRGKGNFVSKLNKHIGDMKTEKLYVTLEETVKELKFIGEAKEKIINFVDGRL